MTDKEVRATAIKEVTYADMIAIGATEEIATAASWKARCAFEASWDCAVDKACEWLSNNLHLVRDWSGTPAQNYRELVMMLREEMQ